jgi:hypothetical protein
LKRMSRTKVGDQAHIFFMISCTNTGTFKEMRIPVSPSKHQNMRYEKIKNNRRFDEPLLSMITTPVHRDSKI